MGVLLCVPEGYTGLPAAPTTQPAIRRIFKILTLVQHGMGAQIHEPAHEM